ncbi:MAG: hypothetical protein M3P08_09165 [Thermoproteota archaeon]|nr:hypothetical protein [Thermoproteota archaeon]
MNKTCFFLVSFPLSNLRLSIYDNGDTVGRASEGSSQSSNMPYPPGTTPGAPASESDPALRQCAMRGDEYGAISATLNGRKLQNLDQYRTANGFFNLTVPKDNAYNNRPGTWRALSEGFFVFLEPLPPGNHDLHLTTSVLNPFNTSYNYSADLIYHLIAKP